MPPDPATPPPEAPAETGALIQIGWMLSPGLAAEFNLTPLSDEYLFTLEQAEADGGVKTEFQQRLVPIYRRADK